MKYIFICVHLWFLFLGVLHSIENRYIITAEEFKRECLEMYVNGSGFRAIERVKKVHHTEDFLFSSV